MANKFECPVDMEEVTIYEFGASNLKGRTMNTDRGAKVIDRIRPYKYKALTVYFTDGSNQVRDYDEPFRLYRDQRDDPESLNFVGYTYDGNDKGNYDLYYDGDKVTELRCSEDVAFELVNNLNGRLKPACQRNTTTPISGT